jgi:CBS domain-containing protein
MKVKDIMTRNVVYVDAAAAVEQAGRLMQQHDIGSLPVCDPGGRVAGIVTDRDIVVRGIAQGRDPRSTPVRDVMTPEVTTVTPEMDMDDVTGMMSSSRIRRLPVVDGDRLVGIVALGDVATQARYDTEVSDTLSDISMPSRPQNV